MTQVIAVDWSGRAKRASESIWLARVVDGRLEELRNGYERKAVVQALIDHAQEHPETVAGLDFAFSFPRWYCEKQGWARGRDVWRALRDQAEGLLEKCDPPFWGRTGKKRPNEGEAYRQTELETGAKSVFQIGGAGAVGTGSLRGMAHLLDLVEHGFSIWPFDELGWPRVVEIYPRLLTKGKLAKSRHLERKVYMDTHHADQTAALRERAAGSEDAFDAAVSALEMARNLSELENLTAVPDGDPERIEGRIWRPEAPVTP